MSESSGDVIRARKILEKIALNFMSDMESVWGDDEAVSMRLNDMKEALAGMEATVDIMRKAVDRLGYLRAVERRKGLKVVKRGRDSSKLRSHTGRELGGLTRLKKAT